MTGDDRYQHQPLAVRLWRRRHLLRVPVDALRWRLFHADFVDHSTANAWGLSVGEAHCRMKWVFSHDEVWSHLRARHGIGK